MHESIFLIAISNAILGMPDSTALDSLQVDGACGDQLGMQARQERLDIKLKIIRIFQRQVWHETLLTNLDYSTGGVP
jgi:hypothetical protein